MSPRIWCNSFNTDTVVTALIIDNKQKMSSYSDKEIVTLAIELLRDKGLLSAADTKSNLLSVEAIASDGSTRRFWRFIVTGTPLCIVAAPLTTSESERRESQAAWYIGNHLFYKGCSVPEIYGRHDDSGLLIFEDLGDKRLHGLLIPENGSLPDPMRVREQYRGVISRLVHMQVNGGVDFDSDWCCNGGYYNRELMQKKESGYFLHAFWEDFVQQISPEGILSEFQHLAELAAKAPAKYFLHRDFQSRNIMIAGNEPRFIDFQGGRLGPLAYDLASLLIDPYAGLSLSLQEELEDVYLGEIRTQIELDLVVFQRDYQALALQRNLQIIGAFSYLSQVRGKSFFRGYLQPALQAAAFRLQQPVFADVPLLKKMIEQGLYLI